MTLDHLSRDLAADAGIPMDVARFLVRSTFSSLARRLERGHGAKIRGLGTFKWAAVRARKPRTTGVAPARGLPAGQKLKFVPAYNLRKRRTILADNDDQGMTKYGVVLDQEKTKEAEVGHRPTHCPVCLEKLDKAGACPVHGTEPFEPDTAP